MHVVLIILVFLFLDYIIDLYAFEESDLKTFDDHDHNVFSNVKMHITEAYTDGMVAKGVMICGKQVEMFPELKKKLLKVGQTVRRTHDKFIRNLGNQHGGFVQIIHCNEHEPFGLSGYNVDKMDTSLFAGLVRLYGSLISINTKHNTDLLKTFIKTYFLPNLAQDDPQYKSQLYCIAMMYYESNTFLLEDLTLFLYPKYFSFSFQECLNAEIDCFSGTSMLSRLFICRDICPTALKLCLTSEHDGQAFVIYQYNQFCSTIFTQLFSRIFKHDPYAITQESIDRDQNWLEFFLAQSKPWHSYQISFQASKFNARDTILNSRKKLPSRTIRDQWVTKIDGHEKNYTTFVNERRQCLLTIVPVLPLTLILEGYLEPGHFEERECIQFNTLLK